MIKRNIVSTVAVLGALAAATQASAQGQDSPADLAGSSVSISMPGSVADPSYRAMFQNWKKLEQVQQGAVSIPSMRPVVALTLTSSFGVRSDPFRGGAAMHAGVDIPGAVGTAIYATADGVVQRAGWHGGYGNLVELNHGQGIQTRYGHMSALLVATGTRVTRGQLIGRMGSTGRSTGSHLHYEVRFDGHAVNPMPFMQASTYLASMNRRPAGVRTASNQIAVNQVAIGGPAESKLAR